MTCAEITCKNGIRKELAWDRVQWRDFVAVALKHMALLQENISHKNGGGGVMKCGVSTISNCYVFRGKKVSHQSKLNSHILCNMFGFKFWIESVHHQAIVQNKQQV